MANHEPKTQALNQERQRSEGIVVPMELAHLPYKKNLRGLCGDSRTEAARQKRWRRHVGDVVERLIAALESGDVVLDGGHVKKLKPLPPGCRVGDNANAFIGGCRLWAHADGARRPVKKACSS